MSIASRIENMTENVKKAYDNLEDLLGVDFTNVNKNLENLSTEIESLYNTYPKITGESSTLSLSSTRKGKIKKLELKGDTLVQDSFNGKNLLPRPYTNTTKTQTGITFTLRPDGSVLVNGTCTGTHSDFFLYGSYTVEEQAELMSNWNYIIGGSANVKLQVRNNTDGTFTTLAEDTGNGAQINKSTFTTGYIQLTVNNGVSVNNEVIKPMVLNSLTDTSFEPYVGGTSAPNPNFPQPLHIATGNNTINITGKNLCDGIFESGNVNDYGVETTSNTTYRSVNYISVRGGETLICSYTSETGAKLNVCACYDKNKKFITRLTDLKTNPFTLPNNTAYIRIGFYRASSISGSDFSNVMLVYGNTAPTYEPYENQNFSINLPVKNLFDVNTIIPNMITHRWPSGQSKVTYDSTTRTLTMVNPSNDTYIPSMYANAAYAEGINVNVEPFTDYVWSFDIDQPLSTMKNSIMGLNETTNKYEYLQGFAQKTKFVFNTGKYKVITFRIGSTAAKDTVTNFTNFQVEKSSKINNYNPYGEQEFELCAISDYQDVIIKDKGQNLFSSKTEYGTLDNSTGAVAGNATTVQRTKNYIEIEPSTTYTIWNDKNYSQYVYEYDSNYNFLGYLSKSTTPPFTFTTKATTKYIKVRTIASLNENDLTVLFMLNKGESSKTYEPYRASEWSIKKYIGKTILNGSENWAYSNNIFYTSHSVQKYIGSTITCKSNYFSGGYNKQTSENYYNGNVNNTIGFSPTAIYIRDDSITSRDDFLSWLSKNNIVLYYILDTPIYVEITDTNLINQLEDIYNETYSYNDQTNVLQNPNDYPFVVSINALLKNSN